ncbi:hypothetical protein MKX03_002042 [Papaver bracteatum]|nr:hypothetical protein MKX03_002042 [Papaver bracteatum]
MLYVIFNAQVGDLGLAKKIEHDKSPDATIAAGAMATNKNDVFSYGAVVLEVITGRRRLIARDVSKIGGVGGSTRRLLEAVAKIIGEFDKEEITTYVLLRLQDGVSDCNELITICNSSS